MSDKSLEKAIEHAARHLPKGWSISIFIEEGSANVCLEDPSGDGVYFDTRNMTLELQVLRATAVARVQNS